MNSKNKGLFYALGGIAAVVILFGILLIAKGSGTSTKPTTQTNSTGSSAAPAAVTAAVSGVQQSMLDTIGMGSAENGPLGITAPALTAQNKPEILYEGAEYCPFCATERWPMAVALSKFGSFTNLKVTHSSTTDVYPNTQTLSFYGSTYTSQYLTFTPIEIYSNVSNGNGGYTTLQTPTADENNIVMKYDATPYLPADAAGSIPFIDFGGKYLIAGATYSPAVLQGKSASTIASSLSQPTTPIAKGVDGAANTMIAAICKLTNNQPTTVCDPTIQKLESTL